MTLLLLHPPCNICLTTDSIRLETTSEIIEPNHHYNNPTMGPSSTSSPKPLQGQRLHRLPGQPAPMSDHPFHKAVPAGVPRPSVPVQLAVPSPCRCSPAAPRRRTGQAGASAERARPAPPATNLHEGVSQVAGAVHHRQMAPRHDLDLQLPRHLLPPLPSSSRGRRDSATAPVPWSGGRGRCACAGLGGRPALGTGSGKGLTAAGNGDYSWKGALESAQSNLPAQAG